MVMRIVLSVGWGSDGGDDKSSVRLYVGKKVVATLTLGDKLLDI
jgi:hypothetical protein